MTLFMLMAPIDSCCLASKHKTHNVLLFINNYCNESFPHNMTKIHIVHHIIAKAFLMYSAFCVEKQKILTSSTM
jgi:hypothetical protein